MDKRFVWREVEKIAASYPLMECDRCAVAVSVWLRENDIPFKFIRLKTKRRSDFFIVSRRYGMADAITENGIHYGVEVFGLVFDNLGGSGLSRDDWLGDFRCRSGQFIVEILDSLEV